MATIAPTDLSALGEVTVVKTTLTGTDDFVYNKGKRPILILDNVTAGALSVTIDGAAATTQYVNGVGNIDISAGYTTASIGAGACIAIELKEISSYLAGAIAVTGGTGIEAQLLEF